MPEGYARFEGLIAVLGRRPLTEAERLELVAELGEYATGRLVGLYEAHRIMLSARGRSKQHDRLPDARRNYIARFWAAHGAILKAAHAALSEAKGKKA